MAGNPTVIPGLFKADLSGLATLAKAIGEFATRDDRKIDQAMEIYRDPVYAESMAERLVTAEAESFFDPPNIGALFKGEIPENALSRAHDAEMIAAGLDPTNQKHREAAQSIFGMARSSLDPKRAAELRVGALPKARKEAEKLKQTQLETEQKEVEVVGQALRLTELEQAFAVDNWDAEKSYRENLMAIRNTITEMRKELVENFVPLWRENPLLANLMAVGGEESFVQGVLKYMVAGPDNALTPKDDRELAQIEAAREATFSKQMSELVGATGDTLMIGLSGALNEYRAWDRLGKYGMRDSMFPMVPVLYSGIGGGLLGVFKKVPKMQMLYGLQPIGLNISPYRWAGWRDRVIQSYFEDGPEATLAILKKNPTWKRMTDQQKGYVLGTFESVQVYLEVPGITATAAPAVSTSPNQLGRPPATQPRPGAAPVYPRRPQ